MSTTTGFSRDLAVATAATLLIGGLSFALHYGGPQQTAAAAREDLARNRMTSATLRLRNELRRNPDAPEIRLLMGKIMLDTGDPAAAARELRQAAKHGAGPDAVRPLLARATLEMGENRRLLNEFSPDDVRSSVGRADILVARAHAHLAIGEVDDAALAAVQALASQPGHSGARVILGLVTGQRGDLDAASRELQAVLEVEPHSIDALRAAAVTDMARGDRDAAVRSLQRVTALRPTDAVSHFHAARLLLELDRIEEARSQIAAMRRKADRQPWLGHVLALLAMREYRLPTARQRVSEALAATPDFIPSLLLASRIESELGDETLARQHLRRILELDAGNVAARQALDDLRGRARRQ